MPSTNALPGGSPAAGQPAEPTGLTMFRNGSVYSSADPFATAILVDGDTVAWTGSEQAASSIADSRMRQVDLDGALVAPGFVDSHVHLTETGAALGTVDLAGARSLTELLELVSAGARSAEGTVLGHGWDQSGWPENRPPTADELDRASGGRRVYLTRADVHSGVISGALAAALPLDGADGWDGRGTVARSAHELVRREVLAFSPDRRRGLQRDALRSMARRGYVAAVEMAAPHIGGREDLGVLLDLAGSPEAAGLPGVFAYWGQAVSSETEAAAVMDSFGGRIRGLGGDLNVDGSLGSRTARLRAPYTDEPGSRGTLYLTRTEIAAHLAACTMAGVQAGFHVIGDAGLDEVLAGFALAAGELGPERLRSGRHRLEHVEMADEAAVAALLDFGVTVSMQPSFDALWGGPGGQYEQRLGRERAAGMNAVGRFLSAGVPVALGSDSPVTAQSPWAAVRACLEHHSAPARISARAAFLAHTRAGYRAVGAADPMLGQLGPGTPATFAVWRADALMVQTPDSRVSSWSTDARAGTPMLPALDTDTAPECLLTVRGGSTLFDAGALAGWAAA